MMSTNKIIPFLKHVEPDNYIYCDACKSVIWFNTLVQHLRTKHSIGYQQREFMVNYFRLEKVAMTKHDIHPVNHTMSGFILAWKFCLAFGWK